MPQDDESFATNQSPAANHDAFDAETWKKGALEAGRMRIPHIAVVETCGKSLPWTERTGMRFENFYTEARIPDFVGSAAGQERLAELQEGAHRRGVQFEDLPCVDLRNAVVGTVAASDGQVRREWVLRPGLATYYVWAATSNSLDRPIPGDSETLREKWGVDPTGLQDVHLLPSPAKIGVGTAVMTSDGFLVLGTRLKTFVAGAAAFKDSEVRQPVHVVAEGMVPSDMRNGYIDPVCSAERGLEEELNMNAADQHLVSNLSATGFFFDNLRWQPCFAYLAQLGISWDEFRERVLEAADSWEFERFHKFDFDERAISRDLLRLLVGTHKSLQLSSNHAAAVIWFALVYRYGFDPVIAALEDLS